MTCFCLTGGKTRRFNYSSKKIFGRGVSEWGRRDLAPAYDLTCSLNPELHITTRSRALSVNGKREHIDLQDLRQIAERYTIRNAGGIIAAVQAAADYWRDCVRQLKLPARIIRSISKNFSYFE